MNSQNLIISCVFGLICFGPTAKWTETDFDVITPPQVNSTPHGAFSEIESMSSSESVAVGNEIGSNSTGQSPTDICSVVTFRFIHDKIWENSDPSSICLMGVRGNCWNHSYFTPYSSMETAFWSHSTWTALGEVCFYSFLPADCHLSVASVFLELWTAASLFLCTFCVTVCFHNNMKFLHRIKELKIPQQATNYYKIVENSANQEHSHNSGEEIHSIESSCDPEQQLHDSSQLLDVLREEHPYGTAFVSLEEVSNDFSYLNVLEKDDETSINLNCDEYRKPDTSQVDIKDESFTELSLEQYIQHNWSDAIRVESELMLEDLNAAFTEESCIELPEEWMIALDRNMILDWCEVIKFKSERVLKEISLEKSSHFNDRTMFDWCETIQYEAEKVLKEISAERQTALEKIMHYWYENDSNNDVISEWSDEFYDDMLCDWNHHIQEESEKLLQELALTSCEIQGTESLLARLSALERSIKLYSSESIRSEIERLVKDFSLEKY